MKISLTHPTASIATDRSRGLYLRVCISPADLQSRGSWEMTDARTNSLVGTAISLFLGWGLQPICKFSGAVSALRSLFRVAFVDHCREPSNSIARTFEISPIVLSSSALHVSNKAWSQQHDVQRKPAPGA